MVLRSRAVNLGYSGDFLGEEDLVRVSSEKGRGGGSEKIRVSTFLFGGYPCPVNYSTVRKFNNKEQKQ